MRKGSNYNLLLFFSALIFLGLVFISFSGLGASPVRGFASNGVKKNQGYSNFEVYLKELNESLGKLWQNFNSIFQKEEKTEKQKENHQTRGSSPSARNDGGEARNDVGQRTSKSEVEKIEETKPAYEQAIIRAVKKASPAVVSVVISKYVPVVEEYYVNPFGNLPEEFKPFFEFKIPEYKQKGVKKQEIGGGSGFIVSSDGLVVTNKHVVLDKEASYTVLLNDGRKFEAKVLARDPFIDVAILKINAKNLPTVELGDSDRIEIGQTAIAIGNALGEFRNTVSVGVISGLSRTITASGGGGYTETIEGVIQTDAAINRGNSGGSLLDSSGKVIGINTAMAQGAENIGFAIPINQVKKDIQSVLRQGKIVVPYIGIRYILINQAIKEKYNLPVHYGALIVSQDDEPAVLPYSPAAKAGLKEGDIILEINGIKIDRSHSLASIIRKHNVGDKITLKIMRGGKVITKSLTLGAR